MKIRIADIHAKAASRPPGYVEACLAAGTVRGGMLELAPEQYLSLLRRFDPDGAEARAMAFATGRGCRGCSE